MTGMVRKELFGPWQDSPELLPQTLFVERDEPCFELAETNRLSSAPGVGYRRVQTVRVIRNDLLWEMRRDLGPTSAFSVAPFILPGAVPLGGGKWEVLETVERLQFLADDMRINGIDTPQPEPTDFVRAYERVALARIDQKVGRKRFAT